MTWLLTLLLGLVAVGVVVGAAVVLYLDSEARADARSVAAFEQERRALMWDRR